jgi:SAM-dependent methyltransferase
MELGFGFCGSQILFSAIELEVFTALDSGCATSTELSSRLSIAPRGLPDFLDALVAVGLLRREGDRYSNSSAAALYLVRHSPTYIGDLFDFTGARLYPVWGKLAEGLRSGKPQNEAKTEVDYYANLLADRARHKRFLNGMVGLSLMTARAISARFPWQRFETFADIGGGCGTLAAEVLRHHQHLRGAIFELPSVQPFVESYAGGVSERLSFHAGDFFQDPLPAVDVLIMGHVLHNWNVEQKRALVAKAYTALPPGGALIVYEWLLDDERFHALELMMSLNMLLVTRGGFGITIGACRDLMLHAGFERTEVLASEGPCSAAVGWKGAA